MASNGVVSSWDPGAKDAAAVQQIDNCRSSVGPNQTLSIGASAVNTTNLPDRTRAIRLVSTVDCWIEVGVSANATAGQSTYLPANYIEHVPATPGSRVSVIQASAAGFLYARPVN